MLSAFRGQVRRGRMMAPFATFQLIAAIPQTTPSRHPRGGWDLVRLGRALLLELPACVGIMLRVYRLQHSGSLSAASRFPPFAIPADAKTRRRPITRGIKLNNNK